MYKSSKICFCTQQWKDDFFKAQYLCRLKETATWTPLLQICCRTYLEAFAPERSGYIFCFKIRIQFIKWCENNLAKPRSWDDSQLFKRHRMCLTSTPPNSKVGAWESFKWSICHLGNPAPSVKTHCLLHSTAKASVHCVMTSRISTQRKKRKKEKLFSSYSSEITKPLHVNIFERLVGGCYVS